MTNEEFIKSVSLEGEVWKDVPEFEGLYMASNLGRVLSCARTITYVNGKTHSVSPSLIRCVPKHYGYFSVGLCRNQKLKFYSVHRLVATTFIPNPENKPYVDHINGNVTDNRVVNLRWATPSENNANKHTKRTAQIIFEQRGKPLVKLKDNKLIKIYSHLNQVLQDGFDPSNVLKVCKHIHKLCHGYQFMYYDEYNQLLEKDLSLN